MTVADLVAAISEHQALTERIGQGADYYMLNVLENAQKTAEQKIKTAIREICK